jgi:hypothetical protein
MSGAGVEFVMSDDLHLPLMLLHRERSSFVFPNSQQFLRARQFLGR